VRQHYFNESHDPGGLVGAEVLRALTDKELDDLLKRAIKFACKRCQYGGRLSPHDVVNEAFKQIFTGQRASWNTSYTPFENLCLIMRSVASNQIKKERIQQLPEASAESVLPKWSVSERRTPYDICIGKEDLRMRWGLVYSVSADDSLLGRMVTTAKRLESWDFRQIAHDLGVARSVVYQGKRKIQRRLVRALSKDK
jgi:DNA-directed RNA polymerase specialized sigma24 family protein